MKNELKSLVNIKISQLNRQIKPFFGKFFKAFSLSRVT